jgi:hypothetical protein
MQRRVKLLRRTEYARELLETGTLAIVDNETADRWLRDGVATEAGPADQIWTTCPKCSRSWWIPATPKPDERWTQCMCGHGWLR